MVEHSQVPELVVEVARGKALAVVVEAAKVTDASGNLVDAARTCARTARIGEPEADAGSEPTGRAEDEPEDAAPARAEDSPRTPPAERRRRVGAALRRPACDAGRRPLSANTRCTSAAVETVGARPARVDVTRDSRPQIERCVRPDRLRCSTTTSTSGCSGSGSSSSAPRSRRERQRDLRADAAAQRRGPRRGHLPLHQLPRRLGRRRHGDLRHHAVHLQRRGHRRHGPGRLDGPVPALRRRRRASASRCRTRGS